MLKLYKGDLISTVQTACKYITVFIIGLQTNIYRTMSSPFSGFCPCGSFGYVCHHEFSACPSMVIIAVLTTNSYCFPKQN